jgi:hypothetical protein
MIKNLVNIQNELKAPKSNFNSFGKYRYRSAEDILTGVKPLLQKYSCTMTVSDEIVFIGSRFYIKATVTITDEEGNTESVSAYAREDESKKGMDGSQITGTASSYARKYALNGMFLIDDTKDADTDEFHNQTTQTSGRTKLTKAFLKEHGAERIGAEEVEKLKTACLNAGESMSLERALRACNRSSVTDISWVQYVSLMSQLGAVA